MHQGGGIVEEQGGLIFESIRNLTEGLIPQYQPDPGTAPPNQGFLNRGQPVETRCFIQKEQDFTILLGAAGTDCANQSGSPAPRQTGLSLKLIRANLDEECAARLPELAGIEGALAYCLRYQVGVQER